LKLFCSLEQGSSELYIDRCKQTAVKIFIFFPDVTQVVVAAGQGAVFCSIPLLHGVGYITWYVGGLKEAHPPKNIPNLVFEGELLKLHNLYNVFISSSSTEQLLPL